MIKNLPNFISIYRLVTIPFVAWFLLEELYYYAALFTLLIALSDFLDGFIARYFKVQSELGSYLDAIADKAFVISIFILIGNLKLLPLFIIIIIISRDIIILGSFAVTFLVDKKIIYICFFVFRFFKSKFFFNSYFIYLFVIYKRF